MRRRHETKAKPHDPLTNIAGPRSFFLQLGAPPLPAQRPGPTLPLSSMETLIVVRCPRCGSMDAESVAAVAVLLDRMRCATCGHEAICDDYEIKDDWNERVAVEVVRDGHVLPSVRLASLWKALGATDGWPTRVIGRLQSAYAEPHRAYHTAAHLGACLRLLDDAAVLALAERPAEVEAALWFHDAVYDTHAHDNEAKSAELAEVSLREGGVAPAVVARIADLVRATKDHAARAGDAALVVDIDLSILGESPEVFARYEDEIRREYAWVSEAAYTSGRLAVLRKFAGRERLFRTALFHDRNEANARRNLAASIAKLAGAHV